jgi:hypothetical protein
MGAAVGYGPDILIDEGRPPQGNSGVELGVMDEAEDELWARGMLDVISV